MYSLLNLIAYVIYIVSGIYQEDTSFERPAALNYICDAPSLMTKQSLANFMSRHLYMVCLNAAHSVRPAIDIDPDLFMRAFSFKDDSNVDQHPTPWEFAPRLLRRDIGYDSKC